MMRSYDFWTSSGDSSETQVGQPSQAMSCRLFIITCIFSKFADLFVELIESAIITDSVPVEEETVLHVILIAHDKKFQSQSLVLLAV